MDIINVLLTYILLLAILVITVLGFYLVNLVAGYFGIALLVAFNLAFIYYQYRNYKRYGN